MTEYTTNGIMFTEDIISINGAAFVLFPEPQHTKEQLKQAIAEIKDNRDAVSIIIANDEQRDDLYLTTIFRNPAVHHLRWYEINCDKDLIRRERVKGTPPETYISLYVLPNVEAVREANIQKYGDKML